MKNLFLMFLVIVLSVNSKTILSQTFTLDELIQFSGYTHEKLDDELSPKGWQTHNVEFITDSNLVRRTWVISNKYNELKSYIHIYEFTKDNQENNISFQFSDRKSFEAYKSELKSRGFKNLTSKSKKKKKKHDDKNLYKEKVELYYSEKENSLVTLKEVFVYGMNAFVLYSYKGNSRTAKDIMASEK